uniref:Uncharacterized protein n=1 Tax=Knipowitschia caucasica TaxID=637954 RepID=A0AAV2MER3_KNICA
MIVLHPSPGSIALCKVTELVPSHRCNALSQHAPLQSPSPTFTQRHSHIVGSDPSSPGVSADRSLAQIQTPLQKHGSYRRIITDRDICCDDANIPE